MLGNLLSMRNVLIAISVFALVLGCGDNGTNGQNRAPYAPSNPAPANGAADLPLAGDMALSWQCSDPDGDPLSYDVYFGTQQDPPLVSSDQSETSYQPDQVQSNSTYYWQIVAKDDHGHDTEGDVWNFSTVQSSGELNLVGQYATAGEAYRVCVSGTYAYVGVWGTGMNPDLIQIVDVSAPATPVLTYGWPAASRGFFVADPYLYVATPTGMEIVNITNPDQPILSGSFPGNPTDIFVSGDHAYVTANDSVFRVIDITEPDNSNQIGELSITGNDVQLSRIFIAGDYAYLYLYSNYGSNRQMIIVNVSDPTNPIGVGEYPTAINGEIYVQGSYAYVGVGYDSVRMKRGLNPY